MTDTRPRIESDKVAQALEEDQHEQRHDDAAAIEREEALSRRLAEQLAKGESR